MHELGINCFHYKYKFIFPKIIVEDQSQRNDDGFYSGIEFLHHTKPKKYGS